MNLGDGLLFELENGKPKLILLSHGIDKNPAKLSIRPRAANILSSRQPSYVEEVQEERPVRQQAERSREERSKAQGAVSLGLNSSTTVGRNTTLISSKTHEHNKGGNVKATAKVKSERNKHNTTVGALRSNGKTGRGKDTLANGKDGPKDSVVCLTSEQLHQILNTVQTSSSEQHLLENDRSGQTVPKSATMMNGKVGDIKQEDSRGGMERKNEGGRGVTDSSRGSQDKGSSWLDERESDSRTAIDAKKAQWRRELDEQLALKQLHCSAPGRLQAEEDRGSVLSVQSSVSYREQPAAIKSSLKLGEVTPMEEGVSVERKEEQRRRWLEELDRQREETSERRRREKLLQSQTENHELWATHFDSLQRKPPVHTAAPSAPPPVQSFGSEQGEWEPSSSLSLIWEATSSSGAESVGAASVDAASRYQSRASYLRTMTALLDPSQVEEREKRRLKQLEQQRAIEAQVEERRRMREQAEARRREQDEEEERRLAQDRDIMQRQHELDSLREKQKETGNHQEEQPKDHDDQMLQEALEPSAVAKQEECSEEEVTSSVTPYRHTAVQTEGVFSLPQTHSVSAPSLSAAPPNSRNQGIRTGKENICVQGEGDPYEAFSRTDRSRRDKRRPEWNTQRPSHRFVPASERYPAALQRNRKESRLKRQAELLALQERACLFRTDPPPQNQEPRLGPILTQIRPGPTRKVEKGQSVSAAVNADRGHSPPVPAVRHRVQSQQDSPSPVPVFIPYVRTDEVFNLDPLEPADTPPPDTHTEGLPQSSVSPPVPSHRDPLLHPELLRNTHRQQEILRGLAQLRQGLLQKKRELETDLNPLLKCHDNELRM